MLAGYVSVLAWLVKNLSCSDVPLLKIYDLVVTMLLMMTSKRLVKKLMLMTSLPSCPKNSTLVLVSEFKFSLKQWDSIKLASKELYILYITDVKTLASAGS